MNKLGILSTAGILALSLTLCSCDELNIIQKSNSTESSGYNNQNATSSTTSSSGSTNSDLNDEEDAVYSDPSYTITSSSNASPSTDITTTVEEVYDSVVAITATSTSSVGAGSGVLFASDPSLNLSYIVTCFHVIDDASIFSVTLSDNTSYTAQLVGGYEDLDIAVLSIEKTGLTYAAFYDDSDNLKLGSGVVCIGNPLGTLPGSVSSGIISYVKRTVQTDTYTKRELIQTDVAINSGNSGGGLFNTKGVLIGIVNAKYSSSGIEGLGFAIPINQVKDSIEHLMSTAKYNETTKTWSQGYYEGDYEFGFTISDGYYNYGYRYQSVSYISEVSSNTTGTGYNLLNAQDIISSIKIVYKDESKSSTEITTFSSSSDLNKFLYGANLSIGDTIIFTVTRKNSTITVEVPVVQYVYSI